MTMPEFSVPVRIEALGKAPATFTLVASEEQRAALARRFGLQQIGSLTGQLLVTRAGDAAQVEGQWAAAVVQSCVVSAAPVHAEVGGPLALRFEPAPKDGGEIELESEALDVLHMEDGSIDLGEALAQSLLLALEPFPRADEKELAEARHHLLSEEEAAAIEEADRLARSPFAKLKS